MSKFYEGGIPPQGGKMVYPESVDSGNSFVDPNAGPSEEKMSKSGPATFHGSDNEGFLNESGYKVASDQREGAMKVRDLNDVSHEA